MLDNTRYVHHSAGPAVSRGRRASDGGASSELDATVRSVAGPLDGRVALVAGATRGAGRGTAIALGEAGATVYCTGRSTRERRSEYDRPETIEETAELVDAAGGAGVAGGGGPPAADQGGGPVARVDAGRGRGDGLGQ